MYGTPIPDGKSLDGLLGDGSGRMDASGVDPVKVRDYGQRMFWAVVFCRFKECHELHDELNQDWEMYQASLDKYREWCVLRGVKIGRWAEYTSD